MTQAQSSEQTPETYHALVTYSIAEPVKLFPRAFVLALNRGVESVGFFDAMAWLYCGGVGRRRSSGLDKFGN